MDGIDGLAATESIAICIGVGLIAACLIGDGVLAAEAAIIAGAAMGFLWWNWAPARVFQGDVGSGTLGYLVGFLLIKFAAAGFPVAAFLLSQNGKAWCRERVCKDV